MLKILILHVNFHTNAQPSEEKLPIEITLNCSKWKEEQITHSI